MWWGFGVIVILLAIVNGLIVIASEQVLLAIREIALNTRKEGSSTLEQYKTLLTMAKVNNFLGWAIIIVGALMGFGMMSGSR